MNGDDPATRREDSPAIGQRRIAVSVVIEHRKPRVLHMCGA